MEKMILKVLDETLRLQGRTAGFNSNTPLLGALPELDSLAVADLLSHLESTFEIRIEDDEIDGSVFETVGSLSRFIQQKSERSRND